MARLDPVDVVVVGAGLGGSAFCARLSEQAPQLRIVCLERGDWVDRSAMPAYRRDWQSAALGAWATSPNVRLSAGGSRSADYPIDDSASPIKPLLWNGVGGSTINWAAHVPRLHPSDFRTKTLDGVGDDWPFSYFDLEPYYDLNDTAMGIAGLAGDPAYPPKRSPRMPPVAIGRMGEAAARGFNAMGWHWWPADAAINTVDRGDRHACNNGGPCLMGCPIQAKASADIVYWPVALRNGVELRTHCVAQHVIVKGGRAIGLAYRDGNGATHEQPAAFTVVACNGIGTARLLLASNIGRGADGALGRHLMFHPIAYARGMFTEELDGPRGPVGACVYSHEFYEHRPGRPFTRGLQLQVTRENAPLHQAARLEPAWGEDAHTRLREEFRHSLPVMVVAEDLPDARNRVALAEGVAADGLPNIRVEYTLSENSRRILDFGLDRAEDMLHAAGAYRVARVPLAPLTGWHLLGTARMGDDPATSVTDGRGRCHAVANLIVADGSLFPTAGAVNPGATIAALALKIGDDLAREVGR